MITSAILALNASPNDSLCLDEQDLETLSALDIERKRNALTPEEITVRAGMTRDLFHDLSQDEIDMALSPVDFLVVLPTIEQPALASIADFNAETSYYLDGGLRGDEEYQAWLLYQVGDPTLDLDH